MNMKFLMATMGAGLVLGGLNAAAVPRGGSNLDRDFVVGRSDNPGWSCGMTFSTRERLVKIEGIQGALDATLISAHIGYAVTPWVTLYANAGMMDSKFDWSPASADSDQRFLYGATLHADLFSHEIQDPMLMENKIRVNATVSYQASELAWRQEYYDFRELQVALTASIVNDIVGNKLFLPESIALFGGPVYSASLSDDIKDSPDEDVGLTAGLEVFHTKRVSYYFRVEEFARTGYAGGLNVRF